MKDRIKKFSDISDGCYKFSFRSVVEKPDSKPVFDSNIKIWICDAGVVISGRKASGKVGNSYFNIECVGDAVLCRWEDVTEYKPRDMNCIKIAVYPHTVYRFSVGERVVRGHVRLAEKYRDEIMANTGNGATKDVLNHLLNDGCWYIDGLDVFFLKKYSQSKRYWYKRVMAEVEFRKVKI